MAEQITINTPYGPTSALHWYLSDEEQMWQALKELIYQHGHRGVVMEWPDGAGNPVWRMEVNDASGNAVAAVIGQHLVLDLRLWAYDRAYYESVTQ